MVEDSLAAAETQPGEPPIDTLRDVSDQIGEKGKGGGKKGKAGGKDKGSIAKGKGDGKKGKKGKEKGKTSEDGSCGGGKGGETGEGAKGGKKGGGKDCGEKGKTKGVSGCDSGGKQGKKGGGKEGKPSGKNVGENMKGDVKGGKEGSKGTAGKDGAKGADEASHEKGKGQGKGGEKGKGKIERQGSTVSEGSVTTPARRTTATTPEGQVFLCFCPMSLIPNQTYARLRGKGTSAANSKNTSSLYQLCFLMFELVYLRPKASALPRALSSVSVGGILKDDPEGTGRQRRVKVLTEEQKAAIMNLTDSSQMEPKERKRQWSALDRRLHSKSDTLPPGVLAKWEAAGSPQEKPGTYYMHICCQQNNYAPIRGSNSSNASW